MCPKKLNLLTFAKLVKSTKVTGQSKKSNQIIAERNTSLVNLSILPGPCPLGIGTADGVLVKTDKAKLTH